MIDYDRASWWGNCFSWRGTVLPHVLARVGLLTAFSLGVFAFHELVIPIDGLDPLGHTVLGVALGMLIVFRTNTANQRYWEARSHWGAMVNASRNLVRAAAVYAGPADDLARLVTAYVLLLKEQLREVRDLTPVKNLLPGRLLGRLEQAANPAQVLASGMSEWVALRKKEGRLDDVMALRLEELVGALVDNQGACEKILRTPLPFVYAALIKQALFLYLGTLPFVLVPKMEFLGPLVVAGVSLVMLGIEEAGVEIEGPFGVDLNHLPTEGICATIGRDVHDLAAGPP